MQDSLVRVSKTTNPATKGLVVLVKYLYLGFVPYMTAFRGPVPSFWIRKPQYKIKTREVIDTESTLPILRRGQGEYDEFGKVYENLKP
jgi:hypothetical protein